MMSNNILLCEKCGETALVVHQEHPLCVQCLMARVAQSRERLQLMRDVKPLRHDELRGLSAPKSQPMYR